MPRNMIPIKTTIFPVFCLRVNERRNNPKINIPRVSVIGKNRGATIFFSKNIQIISIGGFIGVLNLVNGGFLFTVMLCNGDYFYPVVRQADE
jgi:hypothetical protein